MFSVVVVSSNLLAELATIFLLILTLLKKKISSQKVHLMMFFL